MKITPFILALSMATLAGCANRSGITLEMGHIGGDLRIRTIASGNQQRDGGETAIAGNTTGLPVEGIPAIDVMFSGKGQSRTATIRIDSVSGTVTFESIASGNQGIDPEKILTQINIAGDLPNNKE